MLASILVAVALAVVDINAWVSHQAGIDASLALRIDLTSMMAVPPSLYSVSGWWQACRSDNNQGSILVDDRSGRNCSETVARILEVCGIAGPIRCCLMKIEAQSGSDLGLEMRHGVKKIVVTRRLLVCRR